MTCTLPKHQEDACQLIARLPKQQFLALRQVMIHASGMLAVAVSY